eukprot:8771371-Pyramimonas_sp.AAC.1
MIEGSPGNLASAAQSAQQHTFLAGAPAQEQSWAGVGPAALGSSPSPPAPNRGSRLYLMRGLPQVAIHLCAGYVQTYCRPTCRLPIGPP